MILTISINEAQDTTFRPLDSSFKIMKENMKENTLTRNATIWFSRSCLSFSASCFSFSILSSMSRFARDSAENADLKAWDHS